MSERPPNNKQEKSEKELRRERITALAIELSESGEIFPFTGMDQESYEKLKAGIEADKDRSDYDISSPTIDELVERFNHEGMRVVLSRCKDGTYGGTVHILPARSFERNFGTPDFDIQCENISPKHLQIHEGMNEKLKELISLNKGLR